MDGSERASSGEASNLVDEKKNVNMYLPEPLVDEMVDTYEEINFLHRRAHDEGIEKNRDFFPTVIRVGLDKETLYDEFDIPEELRF